MNTIYPYIHIRFRFRFTGNYAVLLKNLRSSKNPYSSLKKRPGGDPADPRSLSVTGCKSKRV